MAKNPVKRAARKTKKICSVEGCERAAEKRGYCDMHYQRWRKHGDVMADVPPLGSIGRRPCKIPNCPNTTAYKNDICAAHRYRMRKCGSYMLEVPIRKRADRKAPERYIDSVVIADHGDECVIWPFASDGYPIGSHPKVKGHAAHRIICQLVYGPPPFEGAQAAHSCGNSLCVNPRHLRWASALENTHDKYAHGTMLFGEKVPSAKLTDERVRFIRNSDICLRELSKMFGVSIAAVGLARQGKTWKHVK